MKPEEISKQEVRVVLSADEVERLGAMAIESGDEDLAGSFEALAEVMEAAPSEYVPTDLNQRKNGARLDQVLSEDALQRLESSRMSGTATTRPRRSRTVLKRVESLEERRRRQQGGL